MIKLLNLKRECIYSEERRMKILVVSPHPDDETLGAGGVITRAKNEGHEVYWLNITGILESENYTQEQVKKRNKQVESVKEYYKFDGEKDLNLPTTKLDTISDNVGIGLINEYIQSIRPQVLFLPDYNDAHSDHRIVFRWVYACTKSFRAPYIKSILTMEIISETDFGLPDHPFIPNVYIDVSNYIEKKIGAFKLYETETGNHPFPRNLNNVKALAHIRGAEAGVKYAEGFRLIKSIW